MSRTFRGIRSPETEWNRKITEEMHDKCPRFGCGCGTLVKKPLSSRRPRCPGGVGTVQRDLYSACRARHAESEGAPSEAAREGWRTVESLLRETVEKIRRTAIGSIRPASFGF